MSPARRNPAVSCHSVSWLSGASSAACSGSGSEVVAAGGADRSRLCDQRLQRGQSRRQLQRREGRRPDARRAGAELDRAGTGDPLAEQPAVEVGELDAGEDQCGGVLDGAPGLLRAAGRARVGPGEGGRALVDQALGPRRRRVRDRARGQQPLQLRGRPEPVHQQPGEHADVHHRPGAVEQPPRGLDERVERLRIGGVGVPRQRLGRRGRRGLRDVGGHEQVAGQASIPDLAEHPVDLRDGVVRRQRGTGAGDRRVHRHEVPELAVAEAVVDRAAQGLCRERRCADDMHHRHVLGVAAGDRVDGAELADAEGRAQGSHAAHPPVPVRGIPGVQLVRAPGPPHRRVVGDVVEHREGVVARDPEHAVDAQLGQPVDEMVGDPVAAAVRGPGGRRGGRRHAWAPGDGSGGWCPHCPTAGGGEKHRRGSR